MSKAKIAAIVGGIFYTLNAAFTYYMSVQQMRHLNLDYFQSELNMPLTEDMVQMAMTISLILTALLAIGLVVLVWLAVFKFEKLNKKGRNNWRILLLAVGIFWGIQSFINGWQVVLTLPLAISFVLAYIWIRQADAGHQL